MGAKHRRKVAGAQQGSAINKLHTQLAQLAGYCRVTALSTQAVIRALVEHLGCEEQVRVILRKYEDEAKAAEEAAKKTEAEILGQRDCVHGHRTCETCQWVSGYPRELTDAGAPEPPAAEIHAGAETPVG